MTCRNIVLGGKTKAYIQRGKGCQVLEQMSNYSGGEAHAGAHLGGGVDPDSSIEQDVVTQLLQ